MIRLGRWTILLFLLYGCQSATRQVSNYDRQGNQSKTLAEYTDVSLMRTALPGEIGTESVVGGILLGPVYNLISSALKDQLNRREQEFIGSYSNSKAFLAGDLTQGNHTLNIQRFAIDRMADINLNHLTAEYLLPIHTDEHSFSFSLESILLRKTKVRYKPQDHISVIIQIAVHNISQEDALLGQGTLIVPILKLSDEVQNLSEFKDQINQVVIANPGLSASDILKVSVTITETNISKLEPDRTYQLILNNSENLQNLLQSLFNR